LNAAPVALTKGRLSRIIFAGDGAQGRQRCLMFLPRMFLVHLGWLLRVIFPVAFGAKSEQERGDNEGDDPSFLRREDKAIAQSFKPRAPDWFQLSDKSLRASPRAH
jgi:hypothetical protein